MKLNKHLQEGWSALSCVHFSFLDKTSMKTVSSIKFDYAADGKRVLFKDTTTELRRLFFIYVGKPPLVKSVSQ